MQLSDLGFSELVGERVALFQLDGSNLPDAYLQWMNDRQINKYLEARFQQHTPSSLETFIQYCKYSKSIIMLGIRRLDVQRYIGNIKISWDLNHKTGDIGIMIGDKTSWGLGMATDAITLLSRLCFDHLSLRKIIAGAYASNPGSVRAFERCGYQIEATLGNHALDNGKPVDVVIMCLWVSEKVGENPVNAVTPKNQLADITAQHQRENEATWQSLQASNLSATFRKDDPQSWGVVWDQLKYQGVAYEKNMLDYQRAYCSGLGWQPIEISLILKHDGQPCGLWPLMLCGPEGARRLTSAGIAVLPPVFIGGVSPRAIKKIYGQAIDFMQSLCVAAGLPPPVVEQRTEPGITDHGTAGEWHSQLLLARATTVLRHDLYVELGLPLAEIRARYRKSYRALINAGARQWHVFAMDIQNADPLVWNEFKLLHLQAASRSTRNDETWSQQYAMLTQGQAFVVGIREQADNRLVGCGFFHITRDEALYAVGAYDRSLFEKPLGHVVQQRAIETMKSMGLRWYRLGERHYLQDIPQPNQKLLTISAFKQGFSSHLVCRTEFTLPLHKTCTRSEGDQV